METSVKVLEVIGQKETQYGKMTNLKVMTEQGV